MGGVVQTVGSATTKPQHSYGFSSGSLASTLAAGTLNRAGITGLTRQYAPYQGSVYGLVASISGTLTSGTITLTPMINGTPQPNNTLVLGTGGAKGGVATWDARKLSFLTGGTIELLYSTAAALPGGIAIEVEALTLLENVYL